MARTEIQTELAAVDAKIAANKAGQHAEPKAVEVAVTPWWSVSNAMTISASVLVFGIAVMIIAALMMRRGRSADSTLKLLGTLLIVISSVFLVVAGYSDTQIAPVVGLLGTIAGYLLGKASQQDGSTRATTGSTTSTSTTGSAQEPSKTATSGITTS